MKACFHTFLGHLWGLNIHIFCLGFYWNVFFFSYWFLRALSIRRNFFSPLQGGGEECLCFFFFRALDVISIHQLSHACPSAQALEPGGRYQACGQRRGMVQVWSREGRLPMPTCWDCSVLGRECHLQPLIHQSFVRKWLLPSCLSAGLPCPTPP